MYTCRMQMQEPQGVRATLQALAGHGYRTVQINAYPCMSDAEVRQACDDAGLEIGSDHLRLPEIQGSIDAVVERCGVFGTRHTGIGAIPPEYHHPDGWREIVDIVSAAARKLAAHGIAFSYHNHDLEFQRLPDGRTVLQMMLDEMDPVVQFELDVYWVQAGGGDPAAWLGKVAGRSPLVHYKDMAIVDRKLYYAAIGEGNLNWERINAAAIAAGAEYLFVEQDLCEIPPTDPVEALALSLRNLQAMGLPA
jgi:sugar phosphate isomerase/epimerase